MNTDVAKAQAGDRTAFDRLAAPVLPTMKGFLWRMIGHPEDCDDVAQVALTKAWKSIQTFDGESAFSTWLIAIANRSAIDFLRSQKRWRRESQIAYANLCGKSPDWQAEVIGALSEPDFEFDAKQHIAYCLVCIGRSLPPDEQAALVLRDVMEFSNREAADVLGASESVLRHRLAAARQTMTGKYEGLCALVSKTGICHQCTGLGLAAEAVGSRKTELPDVDSFARRLELVREHNPVGSTNRSLHDLFFRRCKEVEDQSLGSTVPESDCGGA